MGEAVPHCAALKGMVQAPREPAQSSLLKTSLIPAGLIFCLFSELQSQAKGRDVLHALTLCISSAGCRVPRSSVLSVTPSRLLETFGASTYEGPSRRAGPSYSAQLITPRGRRTTTTKKKTF